MNDDNPIAAITSFLFIIFFLVCTFVIFTEGCVGGKPMPRINLFERVESDY
jgi:hypothetical protein